MSYFPFTFSSPGVISDCHEWNAWTSEPGETVPNLQRLPQSLPGNGCREEGRRQRATAASFPEASEAALESHTSHPGSKGGHEGQSLADETSDPADPCCAQICANHLDFVPDNRLRVMHHSRCTSLKSPDKPHCEDQKSRAQPHRCPYELYSHSDVRRQVKLKCLVSESDVVSLYNKSLGYKLELGLYLTWNEEDA